MDVVTLTFGGALVNPLIDALSSQSVLSELQVSQHPLPPSLLPRTGQSDPLECHCPSGTPPGSPHCETSLFQFFQIVGMLGSIAWGMELPQALWDT